MWPSDWLWMACSVCNKARTGVKSKRLECLQQFEAALTCRHVIRGLVGWAQSSLVGCCGTRGVTWLCPLMSCSFGTWTKKPGLKEPHHFSCLPISAGGFVIFGLLLTHFWLGRDSLSASSVPFTVMVHDANPNTQGLQRTRLDGEAGLSSLRCFSEISS